MSDQSVTIRVYGVPRPGGSKRAFIVKGRAVVTEDCKTSKTWREAVKQAALRVRHATSLLTGPLVVACTFFMPRPKGHYGAGRNAWKIKPSSPYWPQTKPDATKLMRSTEDALTNVVWRDDALIIAPWPMKVYADAGSLPGAEIVIEDFGSAAVARVADRLVKMARRIERERVER